MQTADKNVDCEKEKQHAGPDTAVPEKGKPHDGITADKTIQNEQENVQGR